MALPAAPFTTPIIDQQTNSMSLIWIRWLEEVYVRIGEASGIDLGDITASATELNILDGATLSTAEINTLDGYTGTTAQFNFLAGVTAGTAAASKAIVLDSSSKVDTLDITTPKFDGETQNPLLYLETTVLASDLDGGGSTIIRIAATGEQFKCREIFLSADGTNFAAGGDRNIAIQDSSGTIIWSIIPNATIESLADGRWGDTEVPMPATASDFFAASTAGENIVAKYSGGTTDHSGTGSLKIMTLLEKTA